MQEKNRVDDVWDYKRKVKRDSILLLVCAAAVYTIYRCHINPAFNKMGFWDIYTSAAMRYYGFANLVFASICVFPSGNFSVKSIWEQREQRPFRLLAVIIDLILIYHISKLLFIGLAILANLVGLL